MTAKFLLAAPIFNKLELEEILSKTEASYRHWIQGFKGTKLEEIVIRINPRLSYIFK